MMKKLITVMVASFIGFAAYAGDEPVNTKEWLNDAGTSINKAMSYPMVKRNRPISGTATFEVTINREGNMINYYADHTSGEKPLYKAAERALKMAHFPSIPESYTGDQLKFTLNMSYSKKENNSFKRDKTRVTGTRIALLDSVSIAAAK